LVFKIVRKLNCTGMVHGATIDVRNLGENNVPQSVGIPAAVSSLAAGLPGDCARDALVILVKRNNPEYLEVIRSRLPMRGSYRTIPEFLGLVRSRGGQELHFRALQNEREFIGSHIAEEMRLHDVLFGLGQDVILVEVVEEPNSGGNVLLVDQKNRLIVDPSHPNLELPLTRTGFNACCSPGKVKGLASARVVRHA
jgi:hypothetical protein